MNCSRHNSIDRIEQKTCQTAQQKKKDYCFQNSYYFQNVRCSRTRNIRASRRRNLVKIPSTKHIQELYASDCWTCSIRKFSFFLFWLIKSHVPLTTLVESPSVWIRKKRPSNQVIFLFLVTAVYAKKKQQIVFDHQYSEYWFLCRMNVVQLLLLPPFDDVVLRLFQDSRACHMHALY